MRCLVILKVVSVYWWVTHAALLIYILFSVTDVSFFVLSVFTCEVNHHSVACLMTG